MNKIKIVCRSLVIDNQDRVLLVKKTGSDFWILPGGTLEAKDASLQACLVRELKEELGVDAVINNFRFIQELHKNDTRFIDLIWEATLSSDPIKRKEDIYETSHHELTDMQWINKSDLRNVNIKPEFLKGLI